MKIKSPGANIVCTQKQFCRGTGKLCNKQTTAAKQSDNYNQSDNSETCWWQLRWPSLSDWTHLWQHDSNYQEKNSCTINHHKETMTNNDQKLNHYVKIGKP